MSLCEKFSLGLVDYVKTNLPEKSEDELEIIQYGIEVLYMNFFKIPIILGIGYFLGVFKFTLYAIFIFAIIRRYGSGIHARNWWTCLIATIVTIIGLVFVSLYLKISFLFKCTIFLGTFFIYAKYAPADTEEKPYLNEKVRNTLKIKALLTVTIYFILSVTIKNVSLANMFINVLWVEAVLINPATYKIFKRRYNNYEYYKEYV